MCFNVFESTFPKNSNFIFIFIIIFVTHRLFKYVIFLEIIKEDLIKSIYDKKRCESPIL